MQAVPGLGAGAKELYVFQRTPSSIDIRDDWPTDPNWARRLRPGWQVEASRTRRMEPLMTRAQKSEASRRMSHEEKIRRQENANIEAMMKIHERIDRS